MDTTHVAAGNFPDQASLHWDYDSGPALLLSLPRNGVSMASRIAQADLTRNAILIISSIHASYKLGDCDAAQIKAYSS